MLMAVVFCFVLLCFSLIFGIEIEKAQEKSDPIEMQPSRDLFVLGR